MVRLAKVILELASKITNLKTPSDLAQILLMAREPGLIFFNSDKEVSFLEQILLEPKNIDLAKLFLNRRVFTLSQVSPVCLREISIYGNILYMSCSCNFLGRKSSRVSLNVSISLKNSSGSVLSEKLEVIELKHQKFFDFVPVGFLIPLSHRKYWIELEYSLVNLDSEIVLHQESYVFQPFIAKASHDTDSDSLIRVLNLFNVHSSSYARFRKQMGTLFLEMNLVNLKKQQVYVSWTKRDEAGSEDVVLCPKYDFDVYSIEINENLQSLSSSHINSVLFECRF